MDGMPLSDALFRAGVVMCAGTAIMALFFRFFTRVLFGFLQEKLTEQVARQTKERDSNPRRNVASPNNK